MKWLKEHGWILGIVLAVVLCFGLLFTFLGNPVSLHLAQKGAERYVAARYPGWEVTDVGYDFISPKYYARAEKDEETFLIYLNGWGEAYFDTCE